MQPGEEGQTGVRNTLFSRRASQTRDISGMQSAVLMCCAVSVMRVKLCCSLQNNAKTFHLRSLKLGSMRMDWPHEVNGVCASLSYTLV